MTAPCKAPATLKQGKAELGACLTLVSPSGLTADDRREWLAVAMRTLSGIPADLLSDGCAEARKRCRFPSEIVPTIIAHVETRWKWRRDIRTEAPRLMKRPPDPIPHEETQRILREVKAEMSRMTPSSTHPDKGE